MTVFFLCKEHVWHISFFHSSVGRHSGWFHVLAIVNNAVVNVGVQVFLPDGQIHFLWMVVALVDYTVLLLLTKVFLNIYLTELKLPLRDRGRADV